ncbi:MAG: hypothetical protein JXQ90_03500 [Cyclobacteriaceae bacterium]
MTLNKFFSLFLIVALISCNADDESSSLASMTITSSQGGRIDIHTNQSSTLTLNGWDQSGNVIEVNAPIEWSVDNDHIVVDDDGIASPISIGRSRITAIAADVTSSFEMEVWDSSLPRTDIYVSDVGVNRNGPHQILKYDETGTYGEIFISTGLSKPQDIVFLEDQHIVLVSNLASNNINKFDSETGELIGAFAINLNAPTRIDIGPDRLLYVLPWKEGTVKRYKLDGTYVDDFTSEPIDQAIGMDWDRNGRFYVASFNNGSNGFVQRFSSSGSSLGIFINQNLSGPTDIWFNVAGELLVNDWSGNSVKKFSANGTFIGETVSGVNKPEGVAILNNGNMLIGASGTGSVRSYNQAGELLGELVPGKGLLKTPNAVVLRNVNH